MKIKLAKILMPLIICLPAFDANSLPDIDAMALADFTDCDALNYYAGCLVGYTSSAINNSNPVKADVPVVLPNGKNGTTHCIQSTPAFSSDNQNIKLSLDALIAPVLSAHEGIGLETVFLFNKNKDLLYINYPPKKGSGVTPDNKDRFINFNSVSNIKNDDPGLNLRLRNLCDLKENVSLTSSNVTTKFTTLQTNNDKKSFNCCIYLKGIDTDATDIELCDDVEKIIKTDMDQKEVLALLSPKGNIESYIVNRNNEVLVYNKKSSLLARYGDFKNPTFIGLNTSNRDIILKHCNNNCGAGSYIKDANTCAECESKDLCPTGKELFGYGNETQLKKFVEELDILKGFDKKELNTKLFFDSKNSVVLNLFEGLDKETIAQKLKNAGITLDQIKDKLKNRLDKYAPHDASGNSQEYKVKASLGSIILTFELVPAGTPGADIITVEGDSADELIALFDLNQESAAMLKAAETQALSILGSVRSFLDYGNCLISWNDKFQTTGTAIAGGNYRWTGNNKYKAINASGDAYFARGRWCATVDSTYLFTANKEDATGNKITSGELKGAASLKVGLKHGSNKNPSSRFMKYYSVYGFVSHGRGRLITKDEARNPVKVRATAYTSAVGLGFQGTGPICANYDFAAGGHMGEAEGTASSAKVKVDTKGYTASANVTCPVSSSPVYWSARARYNGGEQSSTNFGVGLGYKFTDAMRLELDYERTRIETVTNRALTLNFLADVWRVG